MTIAINQLIDQYYTPRGITPDKINQGDCLYFAGEIIKMVPDAKCHWDTDLDKDDHRGHMAIEYNGKWYDAECPMGVLDWKDLPAYQKDKDEGYRLRDGEWVRVK